MGEASTCCARRNFYGESYVIDRIRSKIMQPMNPIIFVDVDEYGQPTSFAIERALPTGPWMDVYDVLPDPQQAGRFILYHAQDRPLVPGMMILRSADARYWARADLNVIQMEEPYTHLEQCPDFSAFWEKATLPIEA